MSDLAVVVVVRGEPVERLERMLAALAAQDIGEPFDVLLAGPRSDERPITESLRPSGKVRAIRFVVNPSGERSPGLNLAIRDARADVIVRVDARSIVPADYVRRCVERLKSAPDVGMVGGAQRAVPTNSGVVARGIARALRNPWFLGAPAYRRPGAAGAVDTVYLGAFRRPDVLSAGGYDERLDANEDFDLAQRFVKRGLTVWLEPELAVDYEARSTLGAVARQYLTFGRAKVRFWRLRGEAPNRRQWAALTGAVGGALVAVLLIVFRPRAVPTAAAAAACGVLAVDAVGSEEPAGPGERGMAAVAGVTAVASWVAGVVFEAVRRSPASAPAPPWPTSQSPRQR